MQYVQRMSRARHFARSMGFDALVVVLTIVAVLELVIRRDSASAPRTTLWFCIPAIAFLVLPLFVRRRFPFAAAAAYWLIAVGLSFVDGRLVTFLATAFVLGMVASFLLGNLRTTLEAWIGLAIVVGGAVAVVYNLPGHSTSSLVFIPIIFAMSWLAGFAVRERAEQAEAAELRASLAERERDSATRLAVAEERARIARELHDIVAHSVSVMVLQVGAVRHKLPPALAEDAEALRGVERTGRTALAEMRRLLGAMRSEHDDLALAPQPGLERLDALLEEIGRAGLPVRLHVEGEPFPVPQAVDLSAYRIVQEGLTNVLKHAQARSADVTIGYRPDELQIDVRDDGRGRSAVEGLGHGLVGIRERVKIFGGHMTAGPADGGGFALSTRLPLGGDRA